jgi:hypothetical protein
MLGETNYEHQGTEKCEQRVRKLLHWPKISQAIEDYVGACKICAENSKAQAKQPLTPHEIPIIDGVNLAEICMRRKLREVSPISSAELKPRTPNLLKPYEKKWRNKVFRSIIVIEW